MTTLPNNGTGLTQEERLRWALRSPQDYVSHLMGTFRREAAEDRRGKRYPKHRKEKISLNERR